MLSKNSIIRFCEIENVLNTIPTYQAHQPSRKSVLRRLFILKRYINSTKFVKMKCVS